MSPEALKNMISCIYIYICLVCISDYLVMNSGEGKEELGSFLTGNESKTGHF